MKEVFALKVDKSGRITLPMKLRQHLNLQPGDYVSLQFKGNEIFLMKVQPSLQKQK